MSLALISFKERTVATSKQTPDKANIDKPEENHEERIRQRAYELYEQRGRTDGQHEDDWQQAEQEIRGKKPDKSAA